MKTVLWSVLKGFVDSKGLEIQYVDKGGEYWITAIDSSLTLECYLDKTPTVTTELDDFEANYKPTANKKIRNDSRVKELTRVPTVQIVHQFMNLKNGTSADMKVDGTTPVEFSVGPGSGEVWNIFSIGLQIQMSGTNGYMDFGSLDTLANGVKLEWNITSTKYLINNMVCNNDIAAYFSEGNVILGKGSHFIAENAYFNGAVKVNPEVKLDGDNSDKILATVRDDLSTINLLKMGIHYWRTL